MFHITPPDDFRADLEVAGCFVRFRERFVLLERAGNCRWGGCWDFPGGIKKVHEHPREASAREIREETGIRIEPARLDFVGTFFFRYTRLSFAYHLFAVRLERKHPIRVSRTEHSRGCWVTPEESKYFQLLHGFENLVSLFFNNEPGGADEFNARTDQAHRSASRNCRPRML